MTMRVLEKIDVINRKEIERLIHNPDKKDYKVLIDNRLITKVKTTT